MFKAIPNKLRAERKRWRLTQKELAFLAGLSTRDFLSDFERFKGKPTVEFVLACEVIFGKSARTLFAGEFEQIVRNVRRRADELHDAIINQAGSGAEEKRKLLVSLIKRGVG
jgi:transcriptional regulator with XRE-family HTH domain